jgi:hypothetical protein
VTVLAAVAWVKDGDALDGSKRYKLHLESAPSVDGLGSLTIYGERRLHCQANAEPSRAGTHLPGTCFPNETGMWTSSPRVPQCAGKQGATRPLSPESEHPSVGRGAPATDDARASETWTEARPLTHGETEARPRARVTPVRRPERA